MVPGLALWLPSGYSWGAVVLLICALGGAAVWWRRPVSGPTRALALSFLAMGLTWWAIAEQGGGLSALERPLKYLLATVCLFACAAAPPARRWLLGGLAVGGCGAGLRALYDREILHLERAAGFTNSIQFGDLSLLLGLMCGVALLLEWPRSRVALRVGLAAGLALGLLGSVLSQVRGGWLALLIIVPVLGLPLLRHVDRRMLAHGVLVLGLAAAGLLAWKHAEMAERVTLVEHEARAWIDHGQADTSVGQRLEHWRLAWQMGLDRPWTGWGHSGYNAEKLRRHEAGEVNPFVLGFDHAHNELIDMFARGGIPGVLMLLQFYLVPLIVFWPRARVLAALSLPARQYATLVCLLGLLLPLGYMGFGLTQVFFIHNSGNLFYLFMLVLLHGALPANAATPLPRAPNQRGA